MRSFVAISKMSTSFLCTRYKFSGMLSALLERFRSFPSFMLCSVLWRKLVEKLVIFAQHYHTNTGQNVPESYASSRL